MARNIPTIRLTKTAERKLREFDRLLDREYGAPARALGNKPNPLDEAIYIILSFQTDIGRAQSMWRELSSAFPSWEDVLEAPLPRIAKALRAGGLQKQKASAIKNLLSEVSRTIGALSLDMLRDMSDQDAERFLTRLPGLSWKGARCVLLYSLDRDTFPVDVNTFRIFRRAGILPLSSVYRRRGLHDALQQALSPERRKRFHINLVVHGQQTCLPKTPHCDTCAVRSLCAMRDVPAGNSNARKTPSTTKSAFQPASAAAT